MIYLDNAATSGRKPESVYKAVDAALRNASGNPGRSGHKVSLAAGEIATQTRLNLQRLFHAETAGNVVFTSNATEALNTAIYGLVKPGDHVITSLMEHNSVTRPLAHLESRGVEVTKLRTSLDSGIDPDDLKKSIRKNTSLVVLTHISNVTGTVNPVAEAGGICREAGIPFLVDASQSAGAFPIDVQEMNIDLLAFPGHKSLMGPQGTGGLYVRPGMEPLPLKRGGTGSLSEMQEQPQIMPDRFESGTINVPGIAGLGAGVAYILQEGLERIRAHETALIEHLMEGLSEVHGIRLNAPGKGCPAGSAVSFAVENVDPQEVAILLDEAFDIAVRGGLHCAPDAHRMLGTLASGGTVRVSVGYFNSKDDIDAMIRATSEIAASFRM